MVNLRGKLLNEAVDHNLGFYLHSLCVFLALFSTLNFGRKQVQYRKVRILILIEVDQKAETKSALHSIVLQSVSAHLTVILQSFHIPTVSLLVQIAFLIKSFMACDSEASSHLILSTLSLFGVTGCMHMGKCRLHPWMSCRFPLCFLCEHLQFRSWRPMCRTFGIGSKSSSLLHRIVCQVLFWEFVDTHVHVVMVPELCIHHLNCKFTMVQLFHMVQTIFSALISIRSRSRLKLPS